jgi:hypothetical protein
VIHISFTVIRGRSPAPGQDEEVRQWDGPEVHETQQRVVVNPAEYVDDRKLVEYTEQPADGGGGSRGYPADQAQRDPSWVDG